MSHSTFPVRQVRLGALIATCGLVVACAQQPAASGNPVATKPNGAELKIVSPVTDQKVGAGAVNVSVTYNGPTLVPGAEAKKLDDYHLHYFLDEDAAPFISGARSIPTGNPHIVHSAAREVSFDVLPAGRHTITVVMSGNNHVPVSPALTDSVAFNVE